jgi:D-3-phosphoglycerate dehydrogenase
MKRKIYILDTVHPLMHDMLKGKFELIENYKCTFEELKVILPEAFGVILRSRIVFNSELIDAAKNLKFIARVGAGMESIDVKHAESKGIACLNSPEGNCDAVAEHAIGLLLTLQNNLNRADRQVRQGIWQREANRGIEIKGKCVGILGYGNMGRAFSERLVGFGCRIISYDKNKTNYAPDFVEEVDKETFFKESEIVSLHIPLDDDNYYLIDEKWFSKFEHSIVLINTARGLILRIADLLKALESGKVVAAGLDVLEYEESSFEKTKNLIDIADFRKLATMENVIFTPHIGGWTVESKVKLATVLADKILQHS